MQSASSPTCARSAGDAAHSASELTPKDGLFIATECHLASLPDEDGDTALHLAVVQEDLQACKKLLDLFSISGKSSDVHNNLLQTPLHVAVITNQKEIVKLLITHKANPNNPDRYGSTAFHLCAKYDTTECLIEILQHLGSKKLDLNIRDYEGLTALHVAVIYGSVSTFKVLVANGADIDAKDNKGGRTPLIYAIEMNNKNIVEMLLECDASVSQQTYSGDTALHIASGRGLQDIVRLLLRRGADATMKNTHCETPISLATSPSVTDILRTEYGLSGSADPKRTLTAVDSQYASHIARNTPVPIPPQFLKMIGHSSENKEYLRTPGTSALMALNDQLQDQALRNAKKRTRKLKIEYKAAESDDQIPAKRMASSTESPFRQSATKGTIPIIVPVPPMPSTATTFDSKSPDLGLSKSNSPGSHGAYLKQEFIASPEQCGQQKSNSYYQESNLHSNQQDLSNADVNVESKHVEALPEVVAAVEEVEVSSDDAVPTNTDLMVDAESTDKKTPEKTYLHKLMQYSITMKNKQKSDQSKLDANIAPPWQDTCGKQKAVIVERQPQIETATALSNELNERNHATHDYKMITTNATPPLSTSSQTLMKSKSVPSSPQSSTANLYQLAREGLAVAAMANSMNSHPVLHQDFNATNYLKSRPSRQAKIKSGTEELQNLALQGLAVAAMNAHSEAVQGAADCKTHVKNSEDSVSSATSGVACVPKHLSKILNPAKEATPQWQLHLHRSNSMPSKCYLNDEAMEQKVANNDGSQQIYSNGALLALAHANARKENVGQAVSAISLARSQSHCSSKHRAVVTSASNVSNDASEFTKQNLRQAIIGKNASMQSTQKPQKIKIYDPKSREFKLYNPTSHDIKIYTSKACELSPNLVSIKFLPTSSSKIPIGVSKPLKDEQAKKTDEYASPPSACSNSDTTLNDYKMTKPETSTIDPPTMQNEQSVREPKLKVVASSVVNVTLPAKADRKRPLSHAVMQSDLTPPVKSSVHHESCLKQPLSESHIQSQVTKASLAASGLKSVTVEAIKDKTPTNVVAPLQMTDSSAVDFKRTKEENLTLFSKPTIAASEVPITSKSNDKTGNKLGLISSDATSAKLGSESQSAHATVADKTIISNASESDQPSTALNHTSTVVNTLTSAAATTQSINLNTPIVQQLAIGLSRHVLNPSLANLGVIHQAESGAHYLQHTIAYAPYGKDYIPVLMPIGQHGVSTFQPHLPMPQYSLPLPRAIHDAQGQPTISSGKDVVSQQDPNADALKSNPTERVSLDPGTLCQIQTPVQNALLSTSRQSSSTHSLASPYYADPMHQRFIQEQYVKSALLYQKQSSILQNHVVTNAPKISTTTKPTAAVNAVPVQRRQMKRSMTKPSPSISDEQPLNLSKKSDQPLNLMKSQYVSVSQEQNQVVTPRSSVIKVASSLHNHQSPAVPDAGKVTSTLATTNVPQQVMYQQNPSMTTLISALGEQVHPSVLLPPPLVFPGPVHQPISSAALSSLSLPPIHYVNGLPFILRFPPPV